MPVTSNGGAEVDRSFRSGLILLAGIALLATALAIQVILLETVVWTVVLAGAGVLLSAWGAFALRTELGEVVRRRRGEIALYRSEEHTSELQSLTNLVCRLLLEKKKIRNSRVET